MKKRTVIVNNVDFTRITEKDFSNIDIHKLCTQNIRDFWFEKSFEIYANK